MRVLVACEESQEVCKAFRERGHEAYSCDIQPCSGGRPEWHIQADARELLKMKWDLVIAHPPCTYLSSVGASRLFNADHTIKSRERERRLGGKGVFPGDAQRGRAYGGSGKSGAAAILEPAAIQPDHRAVPIRAPVEEKDLPMAAGTAGAAANEHCQADRMLDGERRREDMQDPAERKERSQVIQRQGENLPRDRSRYGGPMGARQTEKPAAESVGIIDTAPEGGEPDGKDGEIT